VTVNFVQIKLMQTLKSSKWLLKLLNIITCFLIYHEVFFVYNGDTENTEIFFFMVSLFYLLFFSL
jgi:hypothetical protein